MNRKMLLALLVALPCCAPAEPDFDILIRGGQLLDGSGSPAVGADVGISGDTIAAVGDLSDRTGAREIDASGLVVAPGFIDLHTHVDDAFEREGASHIVNFLAQGVTTVRPGADGSSDHRIAETKARWEAIGMGANAALTVGINTIRRELLGEDRMRPATAEEIRALQQRVRQAMSEGAWGISAGVEYDGLNVHATTEELIELTKPVAEFDGFYISHMRDEAAHLLDAIDEITRIGEEAGVRVNVTHFKATGLRNWGLLEKAVGLINDARTRGVAITADQYPYDQSAPIGFITELIDVPRDWDPLSRAQDNTPAGVSLRRRMRDRDLSPREREEAREQWVEHLQGWLKDPEKRAALKASTYEERDVPSSVMRWGWHDFRIKVAVKNADLIDVNLQELVDREGRDGFDIVADLVADEPDILFASGSMSPSDVRVAMQQPWVMISSDGGSPPRADPGSPAQRGHPRSFGSQTVVLRRYVREEGLLTLADAVRKMTSAPARFLGLPDRGLLKEGFKADLALFDPETVSDHATYADSRRLASGVKYVLVNGGMSIDGGEFTGALNGKVLLKER